MTLRRTLQARAVLLASLVAATTFACSQRDDEWTVREPAPSPDSPEAIPTVDLTGRIGGEPFTVRSARYTIDRRPGYEKIDVALYGAATEAPCGDAPTDTPSVWLRRRGLQAVAPGEFRIDVGSAGAWEVHYQARDADRWIGVGDANALLVLEHVLPDLKVEGELSACFRDAFGSCVAGRFTASYCRIDIDAPVRGADTMEQAPAGILASPPRSAPKPSRAGSGGIVEIDPRTPLLPTFPCSRCHAARDPNPRRRQLKEFHVIRNSDFSHGEDAFWCYQCHSLDNIDRLRTAAGNVIGFDQAYAICVSCHGDKQEAWERGAHGLILGDWNGVQHKKSCPACHDPHSPRFPLMKPQRRPAPVRGSHG